jgi:Phosphate-induced protein 1 conserved region
LLIVSSLYHLITKLNQQLHSQLTSSQLQTEETIFPHYSQLNVFSKPTMQNNIPSSSFCIPCKSNQTFGFQSRKLTELYQPQPDLLTYHNGTVLRGDIPISVLSYGRFTPTQKSIISDFVILLPAKPLCCSMVEIYLSKTAKNNGPKHTSMAISQTHLQPTNTTSCST